jgi:hypothetical protein
MPRERDARLVPWLYLRRFASGMRNVWQTR